MNKYKNDILDTLDLYYDEIKEYPVLKSEETEQLFINLKLKPSDEIKEKIIHGNLRLVLKKAFYYYKVNNFSKEILQDLIQAGNIGLIEAVDKFDVTKGVTFSTYAMHWIRKYMIEFLSNLNIIILPKHLETQIRQLQKAEDILAKKLKRKPTDVELANELKVPLENLKNTKEIINLNNIFSLDVLVNSECEEENLQLSNIILDKDASSEIDNAIDKIIVSELFRKLTERERIIIKYRFGFEEEPKTLDEIGQMFGLTRERINQILKKSLKRLKVELEKKVDINKLRKVKH